MSVVSDVEAAFKGFVDAVTNEINNLKNEANSTPNSEIEAVTAKINEATKSFVESNETKEAPSGSVGSTTAIGGVPVPSQSEAEAALAQAQKEEAEFVPK